MVGIRVRAAITVPTMAGLSRDFRTLWAAHDVRIRHDGVKRLQHFEVGELELTYQSVDS